MKSMTDLNGELLDNGGGSGLGRVVEDLVNSLVDNLGRHGGSKDDGSLLVAGLGPEVGGGLSTGELSPDVDVVCELAQILELNGANGGHDKDKGL